MTNAVKHGLVVHPKLWPGLNSYWQTIGSKNETLPFFHYRAYHFAKRYAPRGTTPDRANFETHHELKIKVFPHLQHLSEAERTEKLNFLIEERVNYLEPVRK